MKRELFINLTFRIARPIYPDDPLCPKRERAGVFPGEIAQQFIGADYSWIMAQRFESILVDIIKRKGGFGDW